MTAHPVVLIPGDGIGPEVTAAMCRVIAALSVPIEWIELPIGTEDPATRGLLPERTVAAIRAHGVAIKGPVGTPVGTGHASLNVQLRKRLELFAAVRPVRSLPGVRTRFENVDLVVIRENTEGLYSGVENEIIPGVVTSLKVATIKGCERIARYAFEFARRHNRRKITVFHKANIMKRTDGLFLDCARRMRDELGQGIDYEEMIIDNGCMQLVKDPTRFDVLLMENLYGDVVSDLCSGLVGGLGVVPGSNIGADCAVFEAVHGSAPDIAGKGLANPLALIMSAELMLEHLQHAEPARRLRRAYEALLSDARPETLTRDLGGHADTSRFTDALIARLG